MDWVCSTCETRSSIRTCVDCKGMLCEECGTVCRVCEKALCDACKNVTPHGRALCKTCWQAREARHGQTAESTSFDALGGAADTRHAAPRVRTLAPGEKLTDEDLADRPILTASGRRGPSRAAWIAAYLLFGISGIAVLLAFPEMRELAWPFEARGPDYASGMAPVNIDSNQLRDNRNVSQLNLFYQVPFFLITWGVLLLYLFGVFWIFYGAIKTGATKLYNRIAGPDEVRNI